MKHRTTDPACVEHRPPAGWWSRWRFNRNRGRACEACRTVEPCTGTLVWYDVAEDGRFPTAGVLKCSACDYVIATGWWHDAAHAEAEVVREGIAP